MDRRVINILIKANSYKFTQWLTSELNYLLTSTELVKNYVVEFEYMPVLFTEYPSFNFWAKCVDLPNLENRIESDDRSTRMNLGRIEIRDLHENRLQIIGTFEQEVFIGILKMIYTEIDRVWGIKSEGFHESPQKGKDSEKDPSPAEAPSIVKGKRGRSKYTDKEKLEALREWDKIDPSISSTTLSDFLENKFGSNGGILNVAESTFHGWRRQLRDKGLYDKYK